MIVLFLFTAVNPEKLIEEHLLVEQRLVEKERKKQEEADEQLVK